MNHQWLHWFSSIEMVECPTISRPSPKYNFTTLKTSVPGDHNSNYLVALHSITDECPAFSWISTKNYSTNTKSSVSQETWTMNMQSLPPVLPEKRIISALSSE